MTVNWKRNLTMLWFSQLLVMAGYDAMNPFISLFMKNGLDLNTPERLAYYVTLYNIASFIGYGIANPLWGWLGDRYGMKTMLLRGTFCTSIFWPMMAQVQSPGWLALLRFVTAFLAGTTAASQMMLARTAPYERQGFAQGVLTSAIWAGSILGNVAGGLLIHYSDYRMAFWMCGIMYIMAGVFIVFTQDQGSIGEDRQKAEALSSKLNVHLPKLPRQVWLLIAMFALMGLVRRVDMPYISLRVEQLVKAEEAAYWTGIVSAIVGVGAILSGVVCGYLVDRYSARLLILPILFGTAVFTLAQGLNVNLGTVTVLRTLCYFIAGALQPLLQKQLTAGSPRNMRGLAFGLATTASSLGGILASAYGGVLASWWGICAVFMGTGILTFMMIPVFFWAVSAVQKAILNKPDSIA